MYYISSMIIVRCPRAIQGWFRIYRAETSNLTGKGSSFRDLCELTDQFTENSFTLRSRILLFVVDCDRSIASLSTFAFSIPTISAENTQWAEFDWFCTCHHLSELLISLLRSRHRHCCLSQTGVFIRRNGTVEWNDGMERWDGTVEWNGGMEWNGME